MKTWLGRESSWDVKFVWLWWWHHHGNMEKGKISWDFINSSSRGFAFLVQGGNSLIRKAVQVGWIFAACDFFFFPMLKIPIEGRQGWFLVLSLGYGKEKNSKNFGSLSRWMGANNIHGQISADVLGLTYRFSGVSPCASCCFIVSFSPRYDSC